jgi:hypothetical protein
LVSLRLGLGLRAFLYIRALPGSCRALFSPPPREKKRSDIHTLPRWWNSFSPVCSLAFFVLRGVLLLAAGWGRRRACIESGMGTRSCRPNASVVSCMRVMWCASPNALRASECVSCLHLAALCGSGAGGLDWNRLNVCGFVSAGHPSTYPSDDKIRDARPDLWAWARAGRKSRRAGR